MPMMEFIDEFAMGAMIFSSAIVAGLWPSTVVRVVCAIVMIASVLTSEFADWSGIGHLSLTLAVSVALFIYVAKSLSRWQTRDRIQG